MSHRHYCDVAAHDWQCASRECQCICGLPMEGDNHRACAVELRACPQHSNGTAVVQEAPSNAVPIKFPPQHKLRRAIRRAARPGIGATCLWCGHGYRVGEYTPETEDAHLLECRNFPEEGKQDIRERQQREQAR
jgi:hypothetical protein